VAFAFPWQLATDHQLLTTEVHFYPDLHSHAFLGIVIAASFAAGLNVYATVATLGLLSRANVFALPPALHPLQNWAVIGVAIALFAIEFFADKIPAFDLIWNALHTFVRVPIAALLAYGAAQNLTPGEQVISAVAGGLIALIAHSGKTAVRAAVSTSPEPLSNIAISTGEDVAAVGLTWFATTHPYIAAGVTLIAVIVTVLLVRWIWRAMKALFRSAKRRLVELEAA
jgi:hypothetical protein